MKEFYTYIHCRPDDTPFYVGKGSGRRSHYFSRTIRSVYHGNIVSKYGVENIGVFVFPCDSEQQAFDDERQQIAQLIRDGYKLCNMTEGGEGTSGYVLDAEIRTIIIEKTKITKMRQRGQKKETRRPTLIKKGQVLDFRQSKGYKKNSESIAKRTLTRRLNYLEREFNSLVWSSPKERKPISESTRIKMSLSHSGKNHRDWGKVLLRITCPHCLLTGESKAMRRWHFDNCKTVRRVA